LGPLRIIKRLPLRVKGNGDSGVTLDFRGEIQGRALTLSARPRLSVLQRCARP
jgi:hypothetical protein